MERLGLVWAYPVRLTIVAELQMREMTVKEFHDQVGGATLRSLEWHFGGLLKHGWLRLVKTRKDGPVRPSHV
ncbi:MAG TPA: hypothetical protein VGV69_02200, partial [Solirubrobacterales bacterium]|nr:hypothetical protein [Solirubrobacterales bacterium]